MEANFWHQKWEKGDIGFHEQEANPFLTAHISQLTLPDGARVFLPLCGKTSAIAWLLQRGFHVIGAELSDIAIRDLFESLDVVPTISTIGSLKHYQADNVDMYVGDIFELSAAQIGHIDAIYDRAALVALPLLLRDKYSAHLIALTSKAPQLLITYEYDQSLMNGPPFSINQEEVDKHYGNHYMITLLEQKSVLGGMKGKVASTEAIWLLHH